MGQETKATEFETKVSEVVAKAVAHAEEKEESALTLSDDMLEGVSPEVAFAAKSELRYRNTQKSYTKAQQQTVKLSKVNERLAEELTSSVGLQVTEEQQAELDGLKTSDPEKWRDKVNEYEEAAKTTLTEKLAAIETEGEELSEVEIRQAQIAAYAENTGVSITQELVDDHVPPIWTKKLAEGKVSFEEYLNAAAKFIKGEAVIANTEDPEKNDPNLGKLSGGAAPSTEAQSQDIVEQYNNTIF